MHLQPGRGRRLGDLRAEVVDQRGLVRLAGLVDVGQHLQLLGLLVGGPAQVAHGDHGRNRGQVVLQCGQPGGIRRAERALAHRRDHLHGDQVGGPERRGELSGLLTGRTGGQESAVVALGDAVQRRQVVWHRERRDEPGRDDDPAELDGERADSPEDGVNAHAASILGLACGAA